MPKEIFNGTEEFFETADRAGFLGTGDRTVIVAGAALGVGMALTQYLLKTGYYVIALDKLKIAPDWFKNTEGDGFFVYNLDCTHIGQVKGIFGALFKEDGLAKTEGPLHLICTLGLNRLHWFKEGPHPAFKEILDANLLAPMVLTSAFAEGVYKTGDPLDTAHRRTISLYSSIAAEIPMRTTAPYCSAKAGLNMLIRCLAREFAPDIEVYGLTLGPIAPCENGTQMDDVAEQIAAQRNMTIEQVWEQTANDIPAGEVIPIGEVIGLQAQIIHDGRFSIFNSGTNFRITGGRT